MVINANSWTLDMVKWMKSRAWEVVIAFLLLLPIVAFDEIMTLRNELQSSDDYFIVRSVYVNDVIEGQDAILIYDRIVKRPFKGIWTAVVFTISKPDGNLYGVCNNSNIVYYEPAVKLPRAGVTLSWFIEKDCKLPPGEYSIQTVWEVEVSSMVKKYVKFTSNVFTVIPK